jgi:hypothetical protein
MDFDEARKLATRVAKESAGISVKFGETNGETILHLINRDIPGKIASRNLTNAADWAEHPWNKYNNKEKHEQHDDH